MPGTTLDPMRAVYPSLAGRRIFISGGATGIGEAMVEAFAQQDCQVAFIHIAGEACALLADRLSCTEKAPPCPESPHAVYPQKANHL